jgi:hypothetical protein
VLDKSEWSLRLSVMKNEFLSVDGIQDGHPVEHKRAPKDRPAVFEECSSCRGTGGDPNYDDPCIECDYCGGIGYIFSKRFVEALNLIVNHAEFEHQDDRDRFYR